MVGGPGQKPPDRQMADSRRRSPSRCDRGGSMPQEYNPIVRTFGRFRAELLRHLDIARHAIRPETPLESLLPVERRREIWQQLDRRGLQLPPLGLPGRDYERNVFGILRATLS